MGAEVTGRAEEEEGEIMYPHLIEVHDEDGSLITFNIDHVIWFNQDSVLMSDNDIDVGGFNLKESYEELKQLIRDAGCIIAKKDPRLDMEHPLTMEDIKGMVGEPVWNSNIDEWGLVTKDSERYFIRYHDGTMTVLEEEWLKKYPHYRMKK